jgi:spore coat polysaccharide biosynthesis predicted glycosyltransferase SpsG/CMP-N-acetylneuraminic acid synthetase
MKKIGVVIPAFKRAVAFHDDLVRQIAGKTLLQRCIDKALKITSSENILVLTDSNEIELVCQRNEIGAIRPDSDELSKQEVFTDDMKVLLKENLHKTDDVILLSPYEPLVSHDSVLDAYNVHTRMGYDLTVPVQRERRSALPFIPNRLEDAFVINAQERDVLLESRAFTIISAGLLNIDNWNKSVKPGTYILEQESVRIRNHRDWWVCEKLLKCRRIVFRVIGNSKVGLGHIYRALTLARCITDHEIAFVTDHESEQDVQALIDSQYWLETFEHDFMAAGIIGLEPDLVVNDILNTSPSYINSLKEHGIKTMSFEDLGDGAKITDLTINELYDEPLFQGQNIKWGHRHFFLRDEFTDARQCELKPEINRILVTFGGADPNNLTAQVVELIAPALRKSGVMLDVVTGPAYQHQTEFRKMITDQAHTNVEYTSATGVMSSIMERAQIAITSNGRTVYELAHMNIPSIVLSHNSRESSHLFAREENGFVNLGLFQGPQCLPKLKDTLTRLQSDTEWRINLHRSMSQFDFTKSRTVVRDALLRLLEESP